MRKGSYLGSGLGPSDVCLQTWFPKASALPKIISPIEADSVRRAAIRIVRLPDEFTADWRVRFLS